MPLLGKILLLAVSILVCFLSTRLLYHNKWFRRLSIILFSIVFSWLTIFVFTQPSDDWSNNDQKSIAVGANPGNANLKAYKYIWNNFITVDNSFDKILVPNEEYDSEDSLSFTITDRKKMLTFFKLINNTDIDFVVCDINLDIATRYDSAISEEMKKLNESNKLILSYNTKNAKASNSYFTMFAKGNIVEKTSNQLFTSHYLVHDKLVSLPFEIYKKMNSITQVNAFWSDRLLKETDKKNKNHWIANPFFPEFKLTEESLLYHGPLPTEKGSIQIVETGDLSSFSLGELNTEYGSSTFIENLDKRRKLGKRNIVFLGSFKSFDEDIHQTLYKNLHGPVIILNIVYALQEHQHYINLPFILALFTAYLLILWLLLYKAFNLPLISYKKNTDYKLTENVRNERTASSANDSALRFTLKGILQLFFESIVFCFKFIFVEELHFTLLFLLAWLMNVITGKVINIMFLVSYFGIVYISFKYSYEKIIK